MSRHMCIYRHIDWNRLLLHFYCVEQANKLYTVMLWNMGGWGVCAKIHDIHWHFTGLPINSTKEKKTQIIHFKLNSLFFSDELWLLQCRECVREKRSYVPLLLLFLLSHIYHSACRILLKRYTTLNYLILHNLHYLFLIQAKVRCKIKGFLCFGFFYGTLS